MKKLLLLKKWLSQRTKILLKYHNNFLFLLLLFLGCDLNPRIQQDLITAQEKIKQQDYTEAVFILEKVLKGSVSKNVKIKIYYQLGELYSLNFRAYNKALNYYEKLRLLSDEPKWQIKAEEKKAEINFLFLRNYQESVKIYKKLTSFTPRLEGYETFILRLGQSYLYLKKFKETEEIFTEISKNKDLSISKRSLYYLGMMNFLNKKYLVAIDMWKEYIKIETNKDNIVQAKFLIANAYETMEELKKAYNLYYSLMGEYPNTEVLRIRLNSIYNRRLARKR